MYYLSVSKLLCGKMSLSRLVIPCDRSNAHASSRLPCVMHCVACRILYASASGLWVSASDRLPSARPRLPLVSNWRHCRSLLVVNLKSRIVIQSRPGGSRRARNRSLNTTDTLQNSVAHSVVGLFLPIPLQKLCKVCMLVANVKYKRLMNRGY